jgi:glycerophosphoryl diester phosphodiesterase
MRLLFSLSLITLSAAIFGSTAVAQVRVVSKAALMVGAERVLVIGHRGASAQAPENTLPAFEAALKAKADLVELDYYHSLDNVPVVFHDKTLDRTTDSETILGRTKIEVTEVSLGDLKKLDAGKWFKPQFAGTKIPTLLEALALIQPPGGMTLIERKQGDAASLVKLLDEQKLRGDVVVQAFDWNYLTDCHKLAPDLVLGALGSKELTPLRIAQIKKTGAAVIGWKHDDLTAANIALVHAAGLRCWAYTVNDTRRGKQLVEMGIDGLITDNPASMHTLLTLLRK